MATKYDPANVRTRHQFPLLLLFRESLSFIEREQKTHEWLRPLKPKYVLGQTGLQSAFNQNRIMVASIIKSRESRIEIAQ